MTKKRSFDSWIQEGIEAQWCGPAVCYTHDGLPTSEHEDSEFEDGADPCMHIIRLYDDYSQKNSIEANHSPSIWRATNNGVEV